MLLPLLFWPGSAPAGSVGRVDISTLQTPLYTVEDDAFVRRNGAHFGNRPLYCSHISAVVFTGDRPVVRLGNDHVMEGSFLLALARGGHGKWLHDGSDITAKYRPGRMEWLVRDESFGATTVHLDVVPLAAGAGFSLRAKIENAQAGDELIWANGGVKADSQSVLWRFDPRMGTMPRSHRQGIRSSPSSDRDTIAPVPTSPWMTVAIWWEWRTE